MTGLENLIKMSVLGQNGLFLTVLPRNGENEIFLGKIENVTSVSLLCRNFVQKFFLAKSYDRIWRNWSKCPFLGQNGQKRLWSPPERSKFHSNEYWAAFFVIYWSISCDCRTQYINMAHLTCILWYIRDAICQISDFFKGPRRLRNPKCWPCIVKGSNLKSNKPSFRWSPAHTSPNETPIIILWESGADEKINSKW